MGRTLQVEPAAVPIVGLGRAAVRQALSVSGAQASPVDLVTNTVTNSLKASAIPEMDFSLTPAQETGQMEPQD